MTSITLLRLNKILDKVDREVFMVDGNQLQFEKGADWATKRIREGLRDLAILKLIKVEPRSTSIP